MCKLWNSYLWSKAGPVVALPPEVGQELLLVPVKVVEVCRQLLRPRKVIHVNVRVRGSNLGPLTPQII